MRRTRLTLLLVALLAFSAACGGRAEPVAEPSPSPTRTPTLARATPTRPPVPSPTPTPPPPPPPIAPLTGLPADPTTLARPVFAVKIDNAASARPQQGLEQAEIVLEELVEGGTTRFIGLYHVMDPGRVGPVRSGRDVDAELLPPFRAIVAISGAAAPVYPVLSAAGLRYVEEGPGSPFVRDPARRAPYNLYVETAPLRDAAADLPPPTPPWPFGPPPPGGAPTAGIDLAFAAQSSSGWRWDPGSGRFLRLDRGTPHLTSSGEQVGVANVVVARVAVAQGSGVDVNGARTHDITVVGEGEALVLRDGQAFPARWRKPAPDAQFAWLDPAGQPLPLAPGRTWIALLPAGAPLTVLPAS